MDAGGFAVADRVGLSGLGPETISVNWAGVSPTGKLYCGIGVALKR